MHRLKGLEFDRVILAGMNEGVVPLQQALKASDDEAVQEVAERQERSLLYVAITRARRDAMVSSHGRPSPWIEHLEKGR